MKIHLESNHLETLGIEKHLKNLKNVISELNISKNICYILLSEEEMITLNNETLQHNYCTDIITFDYSDDDDIEFNEIYICPKQVQNNSKYYKTKDEIEMLRVSLHGLLHLSGFGDKTKEEQAIMREKEDYFINKIVSRENII